MREFRVLIVDDQLHLMQPALDAIKQLNNVSLETVSTYEHGLELARTEFFHLIVVDLQLEEGMRNFDGYLLLNEIAEIRPSSTRIVMTQFVEEASDMVGRLLTPVSPSAHHLLRKGDLRETLRKSVDNHRRLWSVRSIEIGNLQQIMDLLDTRVVARRDPDSQNELAVITLGELDNVLSQLFGQGVQSPLRATPTDTERESPRLLTAELTPIEQGYSASIVAKARCVYSGSANGIWCVVKVAEREYIDREADRYDQYVRFRLSTANRVELLSSSFADTLGALCYTFAAGSPSDVVSLGTRFLENSPVFENALRTWFSPQPGNSWYQDPGPPVSLSEYFDATFSLDTSFVKRLNFQQLEGFSNARLERASDTMAVGDESFSISDKVFRLPIFETASATCVIHGDLHCDNILVDAKGTPMLIDYFSVGFGPRLLDFAALEGSIRLLQCDQIEPSTPHEFVDSYFCCFVSADRVAGSGLETADIIATGSRNLLTLAQEMFPDLTITEYRATCVMWAMRILKVEKLQFRHRVRLLAWYSALVEELEAEFAGPG